jgi:hypothetical protein
VLKTLIQKARDAIRTAGRKPAEQPRVGYEEQVRLLLESYAAQLQGEDPDPPPGVWIFRGQVDHELYLQAIMTVLAEAEGEAARRAYEAASASEDWSCSCRCRAHYKHACPLCLHVEGCQQHSDADLAVLRPDFLRDPEQVARALHDERNAQLGGGMAWDSLDEDIRAALLEAARVVVCARMPK